MKKALLTRLMLLLCALVVGGANSNVWADNYVKVTNNDQLVNGGVYIIATSSSIATAYSSGELSITDEGFTESSGTITTSTATPMELILGKENDYYTLKTFENKYLGHNSGNYFRNNQTVATATQEQWTITYNETYNYILL